MSIPLAASVLCSDCERISAPTGHRCPACGSSAIYPLFRWIKSVASDRREVEMLERMMRR